MSYNISEITSLSDRTFEDYKKLISDETNLVPKSLRKPTHVLLKGRKTLGLFKLTRTDEGFTTMDKCFFLDLNYDILRNIELIEMSKGTKYLTIRSKNLQDNYVMKAYGYHVDMEIYEASVKLTDMPDVQLIKEKTTGKMSITNEITPELVRTIFRKNNDMKKIQFEVQPNDYKSVRTLTMFGYNTMNINNDLPNFVFQF